MNLIFELAEFQKYFHSLINLIELGNFLSILLIQYMHTLVLFLQQHQFCKDLYRSYEYCHIMNL